VVPTRIVSNVPAHNSSIIIPLVLAIADVTAVAANAESGSTDGNRLTIQPERTLDAAGPQRPPKYTDDFHSTA
jgi:hypothetical protein